MQQANTILGLLAQTSIHAGTGSNTGVIDLPIQREGHNGWPCVFGSAMKGALRTRAETHYPRGPDGKLNPSVKFVFGPESNGEIDHAGAIMVSDARLLLLPIRSLTSQFKWVTCPDALKRFKRDAERCGMKALQESIPAVTGDNAVVPQQTKDGALFLEAPVRQLQASVLNEVLDGWGDHWADTVHHGRPPGSRALVRGHDCRRICAARPRHYHRQSFTCQGTWNDRYPSTLCPACLRDGPGPGRPEPAARAGAGAYP